MTCIDPVIALSPRDHDAVWFDLGGVRTRTASMDAVAWKKLFDGFLERRSADTGQPFVPCDIDADFRRYVGGKPRHHGVAADLKRHMHDARIKHRHYTTLDGQNMPAIRGWRQGGSMERQNKAER